MGVAFSSCDYCKILLARAVFWEIAGQFSKISVYNELQSSHISLIPKPPQRWSGIMLDKDCIFILQTVQCSSSWL